MQGSGSSLELARPRGEGGLWRQDRMPFPEPGGGTRGVGRGAPHMSAGSVGEPPPCSWGTHPSSWGDGGPVPGGVRMGHTLTPKAPGARAGVGSAAGKAPDGRM